MPLPVLPGVSSNVFGTLIYLLPILFWLLNIRNSVLLPELLPELEKTEFHLDEQPYASLFKIYKQEFLDISVSPKLIHPDSLALAGDGTPVVTSHRERKKRICDCKEKGITDCKCDRYFSQPDCDIGWDSSRDCYYHGYDLYMLVDSESDLPVFPHFSCA